VVANAGFRSPLFILGIGTPGAGVILTETVTITDILLTKYISDFVLLTETVSPVDTLTKTTFKTLEESIAIQDSLKKVTEKKPFEEIISPSDTLDTQLTFFQDLPETVTILDTLGKTLVPGEVLRRGKSFILKLLEKSGRTPGSRVRLGGRGRRKK